MYFIPPKLSHKLNLTYLTSYIGTTGHFYDALRCQQVMFYLIYFYIAGRVCIAILDLLYLAEIVV